jgi:hypothetical protein
LLILAALLLPLENGCSPTNYDKKGICFECHLKSIYCHINKQIDIKALRAARESSFHKSLLKETFNGSLISAACAATPGSRISNSGTLIEPPSADVSS